MTCPDSLPGGECIEWPGHRNKDGYGIWRKKTNGKTERAKAHRIAYEALWGPVPDGLVLDHLCRNRACSNPWHMEPVTRGENVKRGVVGDVQRARHAARTHCKHGHELSGTNVRTRKDGKGVEYRACVACERERSRRSKAKRKANMG